MANSNKTELISEWSVVWICVAMIIIASMICDTVSKICVINKAIESATTPVNPK